jgi:tRNA(fMet)-specific endonuclease VapC
VEVRIALDSNRYTDLCRNVPEAVAVVEEAVEVWLPFVILAELRAGFSLGQRGRENERTLTRFLRQPGVDVLFADDATTHHYASLYRQLRNQGTPIPTNDLWIAALVLQHDLLLCARDRHFDHLPQIRRI